MWVCRHGDKLKEANRLTAREYMDVVAPLARVCSVPGRMSGAARAGKCTRASSGAGNGQGRVMLEQGAVQTDSESWLPLFPVLVAPLLLSECGLPFPIRSPLPLGERDI